jgi:nucleoside-triphosphatase
MVLVTGAPGVGKTTLIQRIHQHYKSKGLKVVGITTHEVREDDQRIGFKITNLSSGAEGWLARVGNGIGPRVGKYSVVVEDLEGIGVGALKEATKGSADLVLVDEIGPMEMTSRAFRDAIAKLLSQEGFVIATVKYGSHYPEVEGASEAAETVNVEVLRNNREKVFQRITSIVNSWMDGRN